MRVGLNHFDAAAALVSKSADRKLRTLHQSNPMANTPHLMTKKDTADFIGVSQRTLDRWHALRRGPARITIGRKILYRLDAILAWLHDNETAPTGTFLGK